MTQNDKDLKELLLKDLCARLPYGVKVNTSFDNIDEPIELKSINIKNGTFSVGGKHTTISGISLDTYECKPYLFPLSSMTEEQKIECFKGTDIELDEHNEIWSTFPISNSDIVLTNLDNWLKVINWLNKNHFDYRGLIEKSLAIDATNLEIYK